MGADDTGDDTVTTRFADNDRGQSDQEMQRWMRNVSLTIILVDLPPQSKPISLASTSVGVN